MAEATMDERKAERGGERQWLTRATRRTIIARIALIIFSLIFLIPLYWMVNTALKSNQELTAFPPHLWPRSWEWSNFAQAVSYIPFFQYLINTVIITVLTVVGAVLSNPLIAYGFSKIEWPGRDKVFLLVLATVFIPFPVLIVALFDIFARVHWINTYLPLIVPMFLGNAFWIFLMRQFLMQIPQDLSDAARIDGANELQIFGRVILPLTTPALGTVAIFAFIYAWHDFLGPLIYLQSNAKYTLAIGLTFFHTEHNVQLNLLMAASTLVILPVVVMFLVFQRAFIGGLTIGSIK